MNRTIVAMLLRALLVGCGVALVLVLVVEGAGLLFGSGPTMVLVPFLAMGLFGLAVGLALPRIDALVSKLTHHREVTPYSSLASAAARIRAGSLEQALPGLTQVLADGTGSARAAVYLAVGDRLVLGSNHPPEDFGLPREVSNLAVLLASSEVDYVVPVLDGTELRAALAIGKPGAAITPADQLLVHDVARGAALLLRGVAQNAELAERVRRAAALAGELQASRQRLASAREVERKRLVQELGTATTDRLARLRLLVAGARDRLGEPDEGASGATLEELAQARTELDELLERFRSIARGVYPAVLRDQGPAAALDELAADLPRPVRLTGGLAGRLDWEVESGIYFVSAAAVSLLAGSPADTELVVHLERTDGRVALRIDDRSPPCSLARLRAGLAEDVERLAALGGDLELTGTHGVDPAVDGERPDEPEIDEIGEIGLLAWLPDRLEPVVESTVGAELRTW